MIFLNVKKYPRKQHQLFIRKKQTFLDEKHGVKYFVWFKPDIYFFEEQKCHAELIKLTN